MPRFALLLLASVAVAGAVRAEPTRVAIRAHSLDAKFIGTSMGGMRITLKDADGKVLAEGLTSGGTGDTATIITNPHARGTRLSDDKTAAFQATLDIDRPTQVTAVAYGPVGKPASAVTVTSTAWVLPGRHSTGDGWVIDVPGLVVEPTATPEAGGLKVAAKVTLMCGCPIEPGGTWAAENYTIEASLLAGDRVVAKAPLAYAGTASQFAAALKAPAGKYRLRVAAADAKTVNAGVVEQDVELR